MSNWQSYYATVPHHTVVGDLRIYHQFHSPQLDNQRDITVWLPPSYHHTDRTYPVLYMQDGQNLFDANTSYAGEWGMDETMLRLAEEGYEAIVVGVPNQGVERQFEYNPYHTQWRPARGEAYLSFITDTIKPLVDADFRTQIEPSATGIGGSSLGGLISLHASLTRPHVFGLCLSMSPAFWFGSNGLLRTVEHAANGTGKIYVDIGTAEGRVIQKYVEEVADEDAAAHNAYVRGVRHLRDVLLSRGYIDNETLLYVEENGALHNEGAWAGRLPDALRFLLPRSG